MLYGILQPLTRLVCRLLFRLRVAGLEHVPREGPVLLAANHLSVLDPPVVAAALPRPIHFLAKAELFRIPVFGGIIRRLNAHPVERSGADAGALRRALGLLERGQGLLVFPEGTRGQEGMLGGGKAGAGMVAALAGAPVVPVYVTGTGRALPRGAWLPRPVTVTVTYGPPLRFDRGRGRARYQRVSDDIMAAIDRLRSAPGRVGAAADGSDRPVNADRRARGRLPTSQIH